jgi:Sensors of blue-light using FAD
MTQLRTIVYVSTAVMEMTAPAIEGLLVDARDLNLESGVTGVLLCSGGSFMQCIEGTEDAMAPTWDRIRSSRRHADIFQLMDEPVSHRAFGDWQMGFARSPESELLRVSTARWTKALKSSTSTAVGFELLCQFWQNAR